jgi:hypothetical protein
MKCERHMSLRNLGTTGIVKILCILNNSYRHNKVTNFQFAIHPNAARTTANQGLGISIHKPDYAHKL